MAILRADANAAGREVATLIADGKELDAAFRSILASLSARLAAANQHVADQVNVQSRASVSVPGGKPGN